MATSLGVGHWGAAVASSPPAAEAEANWGMLERDMFFPGEMLCSPGAHGFGYGLHLGIYSWLLGTHPIRLAMPHLFFEVCTAKGKFLYAGNHKVMGAWTAKPQRERAGRMRLFLSSEWSSLLGWRRGGSCRLGWAPRGGGG